VRTIPDDLGKGLTAAIAAALGCPARPATRQRTVKPRGCRAASRPTSTRRAGAISAPRSSREFDDPIVLVDGRRLVTLRDAATYITKLPKAEQVLEIWQIAVEHLIRAAESGGGWLMLARIGVLRALPRGVVQEFNPDRKKTHWGKRKLRRDE
jgi:hypothetical protein